MYSRPFSLTTCPILLWLCLLAVDAQQSENRSTYSQNVKLDVANLRSHAARGDAMANYQLGHLYMTGTGVSLDYGEAAKFLHAAAEQGLPEAEVASGLSLRKRQRCAARLSKSI